MSISTISKWTCPPVVDRLSDLRVCNPKRMHGRELCIRFCFSEQKASCLSEAKVQLHQSACWMFDESIPLGSLMKAKCFSLGLMIASSFAGGWFAVSLSDRMVAPLQAQASVGLASPLAAESNLLGERFEKIARRVLPAVISVEARKIAQKPDGTKRTYQESGSGVLIQWAGRPGYYVLTNNHVVTGTEPHKVHVQLADGRVFQPEKIIGDASSDVAVLVLATEQRLPTARLGDSDLMQVGHWVLAMGSPFGLSQTVTHGIISAKDRGEVSLGSKIRIKEFLQTDAAINPGSSGGPLVNLNGEVIGINTAIASDSDHSSGVAFSIPSNLFRRFAEELLDKGYVARGYLGIQLAGSVDAIDAVKLGLEKGWGAIVEMVHPDSPAATAGIRPGDVILEVDNIPIRNENQFINLVAGCQPGKSVILVVWRERKRLAITSRIGDWQQFESRQSLRRE